AANLLGSAVGLLVATVAMSFTPPRWLALWMAGLVLIGAMGLYPGLRVAQTRRWVAVLGVCVGIVVVQVIIDPPHIRLDPYKYGAYVQRLERQEEVSRVAVAHSPRGVVEAYRGEVFHDMPFLSVGAMPPSMAVLVVDGHAAGSVLNIARSEDAEVMDHTLMAFPYSLAACPLPHGRGSEPTTPRPLPHGRGSEPTPPHLRVLLLGEAGGGNVWLAARHQAASIDVVQPDANIAALLRGPLQQWGGGVLDLPNVQVVTAEPRHLVEHTAQRFDLIQLVTLESIAAGSGGVRGLAEDHLITVEGIITCLECLTDDGLLVATRGIQTPPRDNVKLLATFAAALRRVGVANPEDHIVIVRDFLAVCTIAKASPWTPQEIERVRQACAERELTPVWFTGVRSDELNQPDAMQSPPGAEGDWYHYAATRLFSPTADRFIHDWAFHIRPPTDDRPFFLDFCKLASIGKLKEAFGDLWLTRAELAFLFVLAAIAMIGVVGVVLTLLPLLLLRETRRATGWGATLAYFAAIGLGYLLLEMTFLSRLTRWIGDPVSAAAVTIGGFLLSSGLGSLTAQRFGRGSTRMLPHLIVGVITVGLVELLVVGRLTGLVGSMPYLARCGVAFLMILPLGYLMGFPMPAGLARLHRGAPALIPWAWGVNGFASVLAAPAAIAMGMTWGYTAAGGLALGLYAAPVLLFGRLPTHAVQ
ncbi:MAG: hypothetical protein WBE26_03165, partial [Phycisphaerae bacterium]